MLAVASKLGVGLPGSLYNHSSGSSGGGGGGGTGGGSRSTTSNSNGLTHIIDVSQVKQWSQLCGPRSQPRRHFYAVQADEGRCLDVAGRGPIERGMNVQVDACVSTRKSAFKTKKKNKAEEEEEKGDDFSYDEHHAVQEEDDGADVDDDDATGDDRAFRQSFCFLEDATIRFVRAFLVHGRGSFLGHAPRARGTEPSSSSSSPRPHGRAWWSP
jgi:hypothetical protein